MTHRIFTRVIIFSFLLTLGALALAGCDQGEKKASTPEAAAPKGETAPPPPPAAGDDPAAKPEAGAAAAPADKPGADAAPVATVNGTPISRQLLESQVVMAEAGRLMFGEEPPADEAGQAAADLKSQAEVLAGLVSLELACQEAMGRGYAPSEKEVDEAFTEFKNEFDEPEQLYKALDQYGQTEAELREQLVKNMALKKWQENDFLTQIKVSDEEAKDFYDRHQDLARHGELARTSQIFLAVPMGSTPEVHDQIKARAETALGRLKAGESFQAVAREMSEDPEAAETGGDLGWVEKGQSLPLFDQAVFDLKPGQTSALVESPMGFHIFLVSEVKPAGVEPFTDLKADIVDYLSNEKMGEAVRKKMVDLYARADIQIPDPQLKAAFEAFRAAEAAAERGPELKDGPPPAETNAAPAENTQN